MERRRFKRTLRLAYSPYMGWEIRMRCDGADGRRPSGTMTGRWHWVGLSHHRTNAEGREALKALRAEDADLPTMDGERKQRAKAIRAATTLQPFQQEYVRAVKAGQVATMGRRVGRSAIIQAEADAAGVKIVRPAGEKPKRRK